MRILEKEDDNQKIVLESIAYISGAIQGDGFFCQDKKGVISFGLNVMDFDFIKEFQKCLNIIGIKCKIYKRKDKRYNIIINKQQYTKLLLNHMNLKTKKLKIPLFIKKSKSKNLVGSYLKGLYDADGSVYLKSNNQSINIHLYSNNKTFLKEIDYLLRKLLINFNKVYRLKRKGKISIIQGKSIKSNKDMFCLYFSKFEVIKRFNKYIGFSINRKKQKVFRYLRKRDLKYKPYSKEEDKFINKNYSVMTDKKIGNKLGRSIYGIQLRRLKLGFIKKPECNWRLNYENFR